MNVLCVIPSRIGSTRIARKPLLPIQGIPMIQRVYENARRCPHFNTVVVATDSEEIAQLIQSIGGTAVMTDPHFQTGSDRVASVAADHPEAHVVVNLQGDEPFMKPSMLEKLIHPYLAGDTPEMTTLASPLAQDDFSNPGIVKVVTDLQNNALYFSRAAIPYLRTQPASIPVYHHLGLYAFRRDFLLHYRHLPQTPLELTESLEQLRALEHGYKIRVCHTTEKTLEINTPEEWERAQHFKG